MKKEWLLAAGYLVLLLVCPRPAAAADESKPCIPEPTDQPIVYGDVLSGTDCNITVGEVDIFRFSGTAGEAVRLIGVEMSGNIFIDLCLELLDPDSMPVGTQVCGNGSLEVNGVLPKTGVYTVILSEFGNDSGCPYHLSLERMFPARSDWPPLDPDQPKNDEINPAGDLDAFRVHGRAGNIIRLIGVENSGNIFIDLCVEFLRPDGVAAFPKTCGNGSLQRDVTLTMTGTYSLFVSEFGHDSPMPYTLNLICVTGDCPGNLPVCEIGLSMTGSTLDMEFALRTEEPAKWNVWLSVMNTTFRLWSLGPFPIDPQISAPLSVPGFPSLGTVGFLTTLTTPGAGIICSDWETIDTGAPDPGAVAPTAEQLRRMFPSPRR